jgi:hypothetical protein
MSISAMKYALDVLDNYVEDPRCETERVAAVNLLRQAIADDKWEPQISRCYSPTGDLISITIKRTPDGEREQIHPLKRECVGQPDLAKVGEVGVWGEEKNT